MNIFGLIGAAALSAAGRKPFLHAGSITFKVGKDWGGLSLGIFSFVCEEAQQHTLDHEFGHAIQNAIYGPIFPFIVAIPSFTRYHLITNDIIKVNNYDDIWFEKQATEWGSKFAKDWKN